MALRCLPSQTPSGTNYSEAQGMQDNYAHVMCMACIPPLLTACSLGITLRYATSHMHRAGMSEVCCFNSRSRMLRLPLPSPLPSPLSSDESVLEPHPELGTGGPESGHDWWSLALEGSKMAPNPRFPHRRCRTAQITRYLVQGVEIPAQSPPWTQIQKSVPRKL